MDAAEYQTNALVVNNISFIGYAFYEPVSPPATFFGPGALELESALKNDGCLAYVDGTRRGLWCFRVWRKDGAPGTQPETSGFAKSVQKSGYTLSLAEEGAYEPAALAKTRGFGPNAANTPSSSSSSGSAILDLNFRNPSSATAPSTQPTLGLSVEQEPKLGTSNDAANSAPTSIRDTHGHFISAVLSALSTAFCAKTGATPMNPRTMLLPKVMEDEGSANAPILASLRAYLTTTGVLVAEISLSTVEGLDTLSDYATLPSIGITVLAAPLGVFATCQIPADSERSSVESAVGQSPDTQTLRLRSERDERSHPWRSICTKLLEARNGSCPVSGSQKWLNLQQIRRKPTEPKFDGKRTPLPHASPNISWPSSLCFCKALSKLSLKGGAEEPPPSEPHKSYDPLTLAKTWFLGSDKRDEEMAKKRQEREAAAARETALSDGQIQNTAGLSPLALQRLGNTGPPAGAMYPTPPDGVQIPVGVTPSMDGTVSSPGNNPSAMAMVDIDTVITIPGDTYHDGWENTGVKRERATGSFESENLFGDLGPDMFGDNDITDADFNFFDEQPDGMELTLDLQDMTGADTNLNLHPNLDAPAATELKVESPQPPPHIVPLSPVFAKPELKHARSSLTEDARRPVETQPDQHQQSSGTKRQASPFNPDTVFKRIRASLDNRKAFQQNSQIQISQPGSIFDKVDFGPSLSVVNSKYQGNGRFDVSFSQGPGPSTFNAPPTTEYLRRHNRGRKGLKEPPANISEIFVRMVNGQGSTSQHPSPTKLDDPPSDADEISLVSDLDDSSYESDEPLSPAKPTSVRRRRGDDDGESLATSFKELECLDAASPQLSLDLPRFSKSEVELSLAKYFADPEPPSFEVSLADQDFVMAAQILMEQASTSTLHLTNEAHRSLQTQLDRRRDLLSITNQSVQDLKSMLPTCFGEPVDSQFRPFMEIQDIPLLGQPTRMQPRPPGVDQLKPNNLFQIPSPHFELRRYESKLSVLPSAISFWESLGLGPSNGNKDINAICIYPDFAGLKDDVDCFLDRMQSIYESLKLGSFSRLTESVKIPGGLLPYQVDNPSETLQSIPSILGSAQLAGLSKLSDELFQLTAKETNFVVFFLYPADTPGAVVESCYSFHQLFERYKKLVAASRRPAENEMALQLVPIDFIASASSLATPSPVDFIRLAIETYDRCTFFGGPVPSPAIVLEKPLPRMIDFKLSASPSASLLHENTCLHIAYAQSIDERWVTAAWTDNRGSKQMTASYCLGRKGKSIATPLADVAHEIWQTTRDLISVWKVHWRIIITKCGVMEQSEIELWSILAQSDPKSITLTLLTVDTDPSLQLIPPAVKVPYNALGALYTTPVSTPQASMVSPEQSGNPPTPSLRDTATSAPTPGGGDSAVAPESDADATLVDVTDQTWGAVLSHRLNNSNSLTELNPAIASGYLVKRSGTRVEDPPVVMEVNIVHSEGNPRAYETLLREMLTYFRGLGTLARARGMVEKEVDVRPWHIAAAEKGVRALYLLM
ncbi:mediator complex subunit 13 C-terminal-domain-containing protein [Pseudomassariella vexata]|uniref:Mediator of RNA polymerase II transcription subunit 13 n=1 Tax=Pseudomassariella vexata TaxID=1141098 RepID=A0A1Y2DQ70_9PEZI|nr:mediator complex subunit 13 C-terminal-domain-containing protein [Pseudomassariella vexata]ORY61357.1 mediator complex subunit 13 C-terminal-domain-containing protein [Pseudomassariella vexata]